MCFGKKRYPTAQIATDASTAVWYARRVSTRVYECVACGGHHLTSKNAPPRMKPGYALPKISAREQARRRKQRHRR